MTPKCRAGKSRSPGATAVRRNGVSDRIRLDDGSAFTTAAVRRWLPKVGVKTLYVAPSGSAKNSRNAAREGHH